jgi:hypothetical protein
MNPACESTEASINTHFLTAKAQKAKKEGKTEGCGHRKRIRLRTFVMVQKLIDTGFNPLLTDGKCKIHICFIGFSQNPTISRYDMTDLKRYILLACLAGMFTAPYILPADEFQLVDGENARVSDSGQPITNENFQNFESSSSSGDDYSSSEPRRVEKDPELRMAEFFMLGMFPVLTSLGVGGIIYFRIKKRIKRQ